MLGIFISIITGALNSVPLLALLDRTGAPVIDHTGNYVIGR